LILQDREIDILIIFCVSRSFLALSLNSIISHGQMAINDKVNSVQRQSARETFSNLGRSQITIRRWSVHEEPCLVCSPAIVPQSRHTISSQLSSVSFATITSLTHPARIRIQFVRGFSARVLRSVIFSLFISRSYTR